MSHAISIIVGCLMLAQGVLGLFGKVLPFSGMDAYTPESLSKMSRVMAVPYLIVSVIFFGTLYLENVKHIDSFMPFFVSIISLIIVLVFHIIINKKVLKKK